MPPLSPAELDALAAFLEQRRAAEKRPKIPQSRRGLVEDEPIDPSVARRISDAQQAVDDSLSAVARRDAHIIGSLNELRDLVSALVKSGLVEVTDGTTGTRSVQPAAPMAAKAAIAAQGVANSTAISANNADLSATNASARSLSAKKWATWGAIAATVGSISQLIQYLVTHFG